MHAPIAAQLGDCFDVRFDRRRSAARRAGPAPGLPWLRLCLGGGAAIMVLAYTARQQDTPKTEAPNAPVQLSPASAPPPAWTPIARPLPIYGVKAPQLNGLPFALSARREADGTREDSLTFGAFEHEAAPHLRVVLQRSLVPKPNEPSFFLDLVRRASEAAGLAVTRNTLPEGLATKFGVMEAAEAVLSDTGERACLAFRFAHPDVGFRMAGWFCPAGGQPPDRQELACTMDRLTLVEAGNDEQLKNLFAQADRTRSQGCVSMTPTAGIDPPDRINRTVGRPPTQTKSVRAAIRVAVSRKRSSVRREPARRAGTASRNNRG